MTKNVSSWRGLLDWPDRLSRQLELLSAQNKTTGDLLQRQQQTLEHLHARVAKLESAQHQPLAPARLGSLSPHLRRNRLPNDDAAVHKLLMQVWRQQAHAPIGQTELLQSAFRVFSQNDEDGTLLRLFSQIGTTNQFVVEIGSNCDGSDLNYPENLSTNLIVHHGWHGAVLEMDPAQCERMRHFFASAMATRHFHAADAGHEGYFSPLVLQAEITPDNVDAMLARAGAVAEPDLFIIDIDGGDFAVVEQMRAVRPRVLVVEFEKRFRDRHAVVQRDRKDFSARWAQSGAASLPAWDRLLQPRGWRLCAIATCGFNAYYVREDVARGRLETLDPANAFDQHPVLSQCDPRLWLSPDESWTSV